MKHEIRLHKPEKTKKKTKTGGARHFHAPVPACRDVMNFDDVRPLGSKIFSFYRQTLIVHFVVYISKEAEN